MRKMFAMVTFQGTAAAETALCSDCKTPDQEKRHHNPMQNDIDAERGFVDCSGNEALQCQSCGYVIAVIGEQVRLVTDDSFNGLVGTLSVIQEPPRHFGNRWDKYGVKVLAPCDREVFGVDAKPSLHWFDEHEVEPVGVEATS